jgi:hypothetical protein
MVASNSEDAIKIAVKTCIGVENQNSELYGLKIQWSWKKLL